MLVTLGAFDKTSPSTPTCRTDKLLQPPQCWDEIVCLTQMVQRFAKAKRVLKQILLLLNFGNQEVCHEGKQFTNGILEGPSG